jgi:hypothetical protein
VTENPGLTNFDVEFCRRIVLIAAAVCATLLLVAIVILLTVDPGHSYCPNWQIPAKQGTNSIWMAVFIPALPATIWICIVALFWDRAAGKIISSARVTRVGHKRPFWIPNPTLNSTTFPYNRLFLCVAIGWSFGCALPLIMMGEYCLTAYRSLSFLGFVLVFVIGGGLVIAFVGAGDQQ